MKRCPKCRLANANDSQFCTGCGFDFFRAELASPWARLGAQSIDGLIAVLLLLMPSFIAQRYAGLGLLLFASYYLLADGLPSGQSVGKHVYKIAVVEKKSGRACPLWRSLIRNVSQVLSVFDWVWIFGPKHARLGDVLAQTKVIQLR